MIERSGFWLPFLVAAAGWTIVAVAGGLLTDLGPWYRGLKVPAWKPPDWAFGPVWTTIFLLAAIAGALGWRDASPSARTGLVALFVVNGVLNIAWSGLFFKLQRPDWALVEVVLLWVSIAALIARLWPINSLAALLLVPYLVWVSLASALTAAIVRLNS
jgi:tryptophan-rich sensory protein